MLEKMEHCPFILRSEGCVMGRMKVYGQLEAIRQIRINITQSNKN